MNFSARNAKESCYLTVKVNYHTAHSIDINQRFQKRYSICGVIIQSDKKFTTHAMIAKQLVIDKRALYRAFTNGKLLACKTFCLSYLSTVCSSCRNLCSRIDLRDKTTPKLCSAICSWYQREGWGGVREQLVMDSNYSPPPVVGVIHYNTLCRLYSLLSATFYSCNTLSVQVHCVARPAVLILRYLTQNSYGQYQLQLLH